MRRPARSLIVAVLVAGLVTLFAAPAWAPRHLFVPSYDGLCSTGEGSLDDVTLSPYGFVGTREGLLLDAQAVGECDGVAFNLRLSFQAFLEGDCDKEVVISLGEATNDGVTYDLLGQESMGWKYAPPQDRPSVRAFLCSATAGYAEKQFERTAAALNGLLRST